MSFSRELKLDKNEPSEDSHKLLSVPHESASAPKLSKLALADDSQQMLGVQPSLGLSDEEFAKLLQMEEDENYDPFIESFLLPYPRTTQATSIPIAANGNDVVAPSLAIDDKFRPHSPTVLPFLNFLILG